MTPQMWRRLLTIRESRIVSAEREWQIAAKALSECRQRYERAQADVMAAYSARCRIDEDWARARRSLDAFSRDDCLALAGLQERTQEVLERHIRTRDGLHPELAAAEEAARLARRKLRDIKAAATRMENVYERALANERALAAVHEEQELEELAPRRPLMALGDANLGLRT
jgi:hypothetical protein